MPACALARLASAKYFRKGGERGVLSLFTPYSRFGCRRIMTLETTSFLKQTGIRCLCLHIACSSLVSLTSDHVIKAHHIFQSNLDPETKLQLAAVALQALDWRCKHLTQRLRSCLSALGQYAAKASPSSRHASPRSAFSPEPSGLFGHRVVVRAAIQGTGLPSSCMHILSLFVLQPFFLFISLCFQIVLLKCTQRRPCSLKRGIFKRKGNLPKW